MRRLGGEEGGGGGGGEEGTRPKGKGLTDRTVRGVPAGTPK